MHYVNEGPNRDRQTSLCVCSGFFQGQRAHTLNTEFFKSFADSKPNSLSLNYRFCPF